MRLSITGLGMRVDLLLACRAGETRHGYRGEKTRRIAPALRLDPSVRRLIDRLIQLAAVGGDQRVVGAEQVEDLQQGFVRQAVGVVAVADK